MSLLEFEATESPRNEDVKTVLDSLRAYNREQAGVFPEQNFAVFARNKKREIIGGATGELAWGWLYVALLWVHADYRQQGVGSELLKRLESFGKKFSAVGTHLGTTDFQALDFYLKNGYEIWGQLPDFPPGYTNYSLCKLRK